MILRVCRWLPIMALAALLTFTPASATEITLWSFFGADSLLEKDLVRAADRYTEETGVTVNVNSAVDVTSKLPVSVAGGQPPDVVFANGGTIPNSTTFAQLLEPLSPLMQATGSTDDYLPASLKSFGNWAGIVYAVPYSVDPNFAVIYNADAFADAGIGKDQYPRSLSELTTVSRKLFRRDNGQLTQAALVPWRMYGEHTALLNWSLAFDPQGQLTDGVHYTLDRPSVLQALQWMIDYGDRFGGTKALDAFGATYGYTDLDHVVIQPMVSANALQASRSNGGAELGLGWIPSQSGGSAPGWLGGQWVAIPKGSTHVKEAWRFIHWLTTDPEAIKLTLATRFAGAKIAYTQNMYNSSALSQAGVSPNAARILAFYASLAPKAQPILEAPIWYWSDIAQRIHQVIVGHQEAPKSALNALNQTLNARIDDLLQEANG